VIVATVGHSEGRDQKEATRRGTERATHRGSPPTGPRQRERDRRRSAEEPRSRRRRGQRTFGKGTCSCLSADHPDGAALKLTIAEYLSPGDYSIQGVGVTPDVELDPMTLTRWRWTCSVGRLRRARPFPEPRHRRGAPGSALLQAPLQLPEPERLAIIDRGDDIDDDFELDFPVRFAAIWSPSPPPGPAGPAPAVRGLLERVQDAELAAVAADTLAAGRGWSAPPRAPARGRAPATTRWWSRPIAGRRGDRGRGDEPRGEVTNRGAERSISSAPSQERRGTTTRGAGFGKPRGADADRARAARVVRDRGRKPGSSARCRRARSALPDPQERGHAPGLRRRAVFAEGGEPRGRSFRPTVQALPRPVFAYTYQLVDNRNANGDGQLRARRGRHHVPDGEESGTGRAYETQANLRNSRRRPPAPRRPLRRLRLLPRRAGEVAFTFDVLPALQENVVKVVISVTDRISTSWRARSSTSGHAHGPVHQRGPRGRVVVADEVPVRGQPLAAAAVVGRLARGSVAERLARSGVHQGPPRGGALRLRRDPVAGGRCAAAQRGLSPLLQRSPPVLELGTVAALRPRVSGPPRGTARDPTACSTSTSSSAPPRSTTSRRPRGSAASRSPSATSSSSSRGST
jgi:carboxyl-terminal processing protease